MSILRKSSAVSRSSKVSHDNHATDAVMDSLSKTFNKSVPEANTITPTHSRRNSERKVMPTSISEYYL